MFLAIPGEVQPCPNSAACWSPAIPEIGMPGPAAHPSSVTPKRPHDGMTSAQRGRGARRTARRARRTRRRRRCRRASSATRSTGRWRARPRRSASTATTSRSSRARGRRRPRRRPRSRSHSIFDALKYGSATRPVSARMRGRWPSATRRSHRAAVRRSCHTMARCRGRPSLRPHATTVSRWSVIPMAATGWSSDDTSSPSTACVTSQISSGSCSTQPGLGKCWVNSRYDAAHGEPAFVDSEGANPRGAGVDRDDDAHARTPATLTTTWRSQDSGP